MKQFGMIFAHAPIDGLGIREALDFLLGMMEVYSQPYLFFVGDGVYHLLPNKSQRALDRFNLRKWISWLVQYESFQAFVLRESLIERNIRPDESFQIPAKAVQHVEWNELLLSCDWFFSR